VFAGDLPGGAAPGARLRPAFDLMAAARLYEASLGAAKAPGGPASLQPAASKEPRPAQARRQSERHRQEGRVRLDNNNVPAPGLHQQAEETGNIE
jgi:hypothetical protein